MSISVRTAVPKDSERIGRISRVSWQQTYKHILPADYLAAIDENERIERFRRIIEASQTITLTAVENGDVVGFVSGGKKRGEDFPAYAGEIYAIYLDPAATKRGIGTMLVEQLSEILQKQGITSLFAWMLAGNSAEAFYKSLGGKELGRDSIEIEGKSYEEIAYGWKTADK